MSRKTRVGVWLSPKKRTLLADLLKEARFTDLYDFLQLDLESETFAIDRLDIIIHKVTDLMGEPENSELDIKLQRFIKIVAENPQAVLIEDLNLLPPMINREKTSELLVSQPTSFSGFEIKGPEFVVLRSPEDVPSIPFPIIIKPVRACGPKDSHNMMLVRDYGGFEHAASLLQFPSLAQPFLPHRGVVFKVYTIGPYITFQARPSLSDNPPYDENGCFFFQTHLYPEFKVPLPEGFVADAFSNSSITTNGGPPATDEETLDGLRPVAEYLVKHLREKTKVRLFGFDFVLVGDGRTVSIIDLNYFPSFSGVDWFHDGLFHLLNSVRSSLPP
eukprot:GCRY01003867.1.p1 GENE.GCRY01003867.1~~GCRY01003867.1.p1  ORF type:complete len:331 (+),score=43.23 GCRY01003867.1:192-1184(+)